MMKKEMHFLQDVSAFATKFRASKNRKGLRKNNINKELLFILSFFLL
jgi:hypothetical protein